MVDIRYECKSYKDFLRCQEYLFNKGYKWGFSGARLLEMDSDFDDELPYYIYVDFNHNTLTYCCNNNSYSPDCSAIYFNKTQINSKLFYTTYNFTLNDNTIEDLSKPILQFGYLVNPINNVTNYLNNENNWNTFICVIYRCNN